ncbi:MAG: hypothetical protein ACRDOK_03275 [Streptosporangiaceae bacterium]
MTRHVSAEKLALLAVGEVRHRKAVRISAHMAVCARCARVSQQLAEVPAVLAGVPYPPLPDTVSVQIQAALRVEVNQRLSAAPATEAGRRDLPARQRQRAGKGQRGWHLPGLSVPASRMVAAAGAVIIAGGGGYLVANNVHTGPAMSSSSSAAVPAPAQPMSLGPDVTYGSPGSHHTVETVSSSTNFVPSQLRGQALGAYHEAQLKGVAGTHPSGGAGRPTTLGPSGGSTAAGSAGSSSAARLAGCIDAVGAGRSVLLVDLARYEGSPATIIVFGGTTTSQAEVVVTASTCSATSPDVLARAPLGHL